MAPNAYPVMRDSLRNSSDDLLASNHRYRSFRPGWNRELAVPIRPWLQPVESLRRQRPVADGKSSFVEEAVLKGGYSVLPDAVHPPRTAFPGAVPSFSAGDGTLFATSPESPRRGNRVSVRCRARR